MKKGSNISKNTTSQNTNAKLLESILNGLEAEQVQANTLHSMLDEGEESPLIAHFNPKNQLAQMHSKYVK